MSFNFSISWRRPLVQVLAIVLLLALSLPAAGVPSQGQASPPDQPAPAAEVTQAPPLVLGITTNTDTISAGETVTATFTMEHTGTTPISATLVMTLPTNITHVEARIDQAQTTGVQTARLKRGESAVQWWGAMQAGGQLVVEMQLTSALCNNEVIELMQLQAEAMAPGFAGPSGTGKTMIVQCMPLYDEDDISLEMRIVGDGPGGTTMAMSNTIAYAGQPVEMEIRYTPHMTFVNRALITAKLLPQGLGTCEWSTGGVDSDGDRDIVIPGPALTGEPDLGILLLDVAPEETRTVRLRGRATTDNVTCSLAGSARAYALRADGELVQLRARLAYLRMLQTLTPVDSNEVTIRVAAPDL
ncbi:MAG: hypothetical protein PVF47_15345, partial [Anaerolineae bacterium]